MAVVNPMAPSTQHAPDRELYFPAVEDFQPVLIHPDAHHLPDQTRRHGVDIPLDGDRAPDRNPGLDLFVLRQSLNLEGPHGGEILAEPFLSEPVSLVLNLLDPGLVGFDALEVTAPA